MAYWLFQANPKYSQILTSIRELLVLYWLVTRYNDEITVDDQVLIWIAGKQAGIYAIARVLELPQFLDRPPDLAYWTTPMRAIGRFYTPVEFTQKLLDAPLLKSWLQHDPVLRKLPVLRTPRSTNFEVTQEQWQRVEALLQRQY
ncbi:EVE domain-containing protein (plasmid) [Phormidium sp. CLA17]|uniref:EVE domain-containing protein n=1 Tax=Leptolyngbya sp. Cla-17 TaxID=2803751 RepID=UPI001490C9BA|nr:EVE domain-containing protein [Leptolyngbya sp. Cla-17]MBM0745300.1 EVE domain-containing protein [Leptolyngbya sp. Cla-17]